MKNILKSLLGNEPKVDTLALEKALQALIECRVESRFTDALSRLIERNKVELKEIRVTELIGLRLYSLFVTILLLIVTVVGAYLAPAEIGNIVSSEIKAEISGKLRDDINTVIDTESNAYIEKSLNPFKTQIDILSEKAKHIDELKNELNSLNETIEKADEASKILQAKLDSSQVALANIESVTQRDAETLDIVTAIVRANNDDYDAFKILTNIVKAENNPYKGIASQAILSITGHSESPIIFSSVDLGKMGYSESDKESIVKLKERYLQLGRADFKKSVLRFVWTNDKFNKYDKLEFLEWATEHDNCISAIEVAHGLLDNECHLELNILGNQNYIDWWNKNKKSLQDASNPSPAH